MNLRDHTRKKNWNKMVLVSLKKLGFGQMELRNCARMKSWIEMVFLSLK